MRELTAIEMQRVAGAAGECSAEDSGNNYGGITETSSVGDDLIELYEGLVAATSYVIERVARAL
jgi:hypothetical protein